MAAAPHAGAHMKQRFVQKLNENPTETWHYTFAQTLPRIKQYQ
jgi:hypothetical protein